MAFLGLPAAALADDGQLGGVGGDYYPLSNTHIRMASETVQATATFPKGKTMIRVSYLARESANLTSGTRFPGLKPSQYALPDIDDRIQGSYDYWLHTGAGWAGTIGAAVVRYTLADDFRGFALDETSAPQNEDGDWFVVTQPASYFRPDDRTFEWVFKDLEPTE